MKNRISDLLLLFVIFAFPLFGILQSCNLGSSSTAPGGVSLPIPLVHVTGETEGPSPLTVEFDASGSYDPGYGPVEYTWYFSDGEYETSEKISHTFIQSGRHKVILRVKDDWNRTAESAPVTVYIYGLANSPWPKYAHDERNSGVSPNPGPMMDLERASEGGAFPRYWRSGLTDATISGIVVGYDGVMFYTQSNRLHARMSDGGYLWDYIADSKISTWPAVIHDGSIIFATVDGFVYRVSPDRELIWKYDSSGNDVFGPIISATGSGILIPSRDVSESQASTNGWLNSFNFDGTFAWKFPIQTVYLDYRVLSTQIFPAVLPDGNIVINGSRPYILTPGGGVNPDYNYYSLVPYYHGAPVVSDEGLIAFANSTIPIYNPDGSPLTEICADDPKNVNRLVPPVWGNDYLTFGSGAQNYVLENFYTDFRIHTHVLGGETGDLITNTVPNVFEGYERMFGACQDSNGRIYASNFGLHAATSPSFEASNPNTPRRYSLWSYKRDTWSMTSPVIGEDGWLYLGYGTDIMAIGD